MKFINYLKGEFEKMRIDQFAKEFHNEFLKSNYHYCSCSIKNPTNQIGLILDSNTNITNYVIISPC